MTAATRQDTTPAIARGLAGVVVDETRISGVDGERGELVIGGRRLERLVGVEGFEAVCGRLLGMSAAEVGAALGPARVAAFEALDVAAIVRLDDAMDALRAGVAGLDARRHDAAVAVIAAVGVALAIWRRGRVGLDPVAPDPESGHAADLLRMMDGEAASAARVDALDAYLVTVIDHGFNASTFAARVVASTGSDLVSAVAAAIGALKGPLHGGAPGPVLDMLDAVGRPEAARAWLEAEVDAGRRIMGMGHRVYRVRDPRAAALEGALRRLEAATDDPAISARLALARAVEESAEAVLAERKPDRALRANVEFYTAVLLEAVGVEREAFTAVFAASRVAGWCAHVAEQRAHGRLIRPKAHYIGEVG